MLVFLLLYHSSLKERLDATIEVKRTYTWFFLKHETKYIILKRTERG